MIQCIISLSGMGVVLILILKNCFFHNDCPFFCRKSSLIEGGIQPFPDGAVLPVRRFLPPRIRKRVQTQNTDQQQLVALLPEHKPLNLLRAIGFVIVFLWSCQTAASQNWHKRKLNFLKLNSNLTNSTWCQENSTQVKENSIVQHSRSRLGIELWPSRAAPRLYLLVGERWKMCVQTAYQR